MGIIGGMSWHSTALYYHYINQHVSRQSGGMHSARLLIYSLNFAEVYPLQSNAQWDKLARMISTHARTLEAQGAEGMLLASNTIHLVAPQVADALNIPLLHIADAVTERLVSANVSSVALLGTGFTLRNALYEPFLRERSVEVIKPSKRDIAQLDELIFSHLVKGEMSREVQNRLVAIAAKLTAGADALVTACTELYQALSTADLPVPVFDSTWLHALMGASFVLNE